MRQLGRSLTAAACLTTLSIGATPALAGDAISLGPAPIGGHRYAGRVSALACHPTDNTIYFAAGADGGVWRTFDGGASWEPLTDGMPTLAIGALTLDPVDPLVIYAGTGEANYANHSRYGLGIYKSIDGGDSWTQLAESTFAGRTISRIIVDPSDTQVVYAAVARAGGFPELAAAKGHPDAEGPLGIFRSMDGGVSWTQLAGGLPTSLAATDLAMDPNDPATLYAGIGRIFGDVGNGIYKTTDGGASWTRLEGGLPNGTPTGRVSLAVAPSMSSRIYALIARKSNAGGGGASTRGAFRSDDGGATWVDLNIGNIQATYGWYLCTVVVHPTDADTVIMGGLTLSRSTNAGATWTNITPPHVDLHATVFDATGRLVAGDDGGVHRSMNLGDGWGTRTDGLATVQFYAGLSTHPNVDGVLHAGAQDNGTNKLKAGGEWATVLGGDGGWTQVDQADPAGVFAEFQGTGNLYRTEGSGYQQISSGINIGDRNCFLPPYLIDPSDSTRMLYATHRILRSNNGGTSWNPISADLTNGNGAAIRALAIAPSDSSVVYAATNDGNVLVSFDGGSNFEVILADVPGWPRVTREIRIDPSDAMTMYLAVAYFGETQVRRTTDAGETWTALDGDLPDVPVNVVEVDPRPLQPVLYAGSDAGLFRSLDDGASWHRFGRGMPNATVIDLIFEPDRRRLIVGTQGRGAWNVQASFPGDLDYDGDVDISDLSIVLADFGCAAEDCVGDVDGDGVTDLSDLGIVLVYFGYQP